MQSSPFGETTQMKSSPAQPRLDQGALFSESALNCFSYRLFLLSRLLNDTLEMHLQSRFGVGLREAHLMALLTRHPELHPKELVDIAGLDKALVSRSLRTLVRRRIVEAVTDAKDHRLRTYAFTTAGQGVRDDVQLVVRELNRDLLDSLEVAQRGQLNELFDQLSRAAMSRYRSDRITLERDRGGGDLPESDDHLDPLGAVLNMWRTK